MIIVESWSVNMRGAKYVPIVLFARCAQLLTLLHSEWPKLYGVLAILSAKGLKESMKY